jgi:hypothetical protein
MRALSVRATLVASSLGFAASVVCPPALAQCPTARTTWLANDNADDRGFGGALACDDAAATVLVGAEWHDAPLADCGAAYVFRAQGAGWTQTAKLQASDSSATARFGHAVAMASNGSRVAIGASGHDGAATDAGAVYVFTSSGSTWSQYSKLVSSDPDAGDGYGSSVALAADGMLLVVGAPGDDLGGPDTGAAYIVVDPGYGWIELQKIVPPAGHAGAHFGSSLATSASGDVIVVGANGESSVRVYRRTSSFWALEATLNAAFAPQSLGDSLAIRPYGDVVLAGASSAATSVGRAAVWRRVASVWSAAEELAPSVALPNARMGASVALGLDGLRAYCGAPGDVPSGTLGRVHAFDFDGAVWRETATLFGSVTATTTGASVACDSTASHAFAGDPLANLDAQSGHGAGLVDAHTLGLAPTIYCTAKTNSLGCTPTISASGCPSATAGSGFVVSASHVLNKKQGLFFYGTGGVQAVAFQGGWLCVKGSVRRTSVQLSSGNPPPSDCSGAYALDFNARIASGVDPSLVAGATIAGQWWSRDPAATFGSGLTDAVRAVIGP